MPLVGLASAQGRRAHGLTRPARLVGCGHGACSLWGCGGPLTSPLSVMRCCTESTVRERMRWGTRFGVRDSGILPVTADGDGDLQGGGTRPRRLILVEELPKARRNKPHHTAGVAWDLLTEEERHRVGLLLSVVENRGVSTQRLLGKIGEGWGALASVSMAGERQWRRGRRGVLTHWRRQRWQLRPGGGQRQLGGFFSWMEIDAMMCGG
jgi:hypothetical protein